jgi:hypothetical protein
VRRKLRRPPGDPSPTEVWQANGDVCAFCALTRAECHEYGIGITVQHVVPVFMGGGDGPLVPFCARCQQASTAEQEKQRRIRERHGSMWDIIKRVEKNHSELLEAEP